MHAEAAASCDEGTPTLGDWLITPHPYQYDGFMKTAKAFDDASCRSGLIVMPTGTGKTVLASMLARYEIEDLGGRCLFIAHTTELVEQACNDAELVGLSPAVERADSHACPHFTSARGNVAAGLFGKDQPDDPQFVVGTVQTLQGPRLAAWPPGHFSMVIVDEGHHAAAPTYRNVIDHFNPSRLVGFTATADRGDGKPVCGKNQVFEHLLYEYFLHDAVRDGWLARPKACVLDTTVDLSGLVVEGAAELNDHEVEQRLLPCVTEIVNELHHKLDGHRAVIFTPRVVSAEAIASAFVSVGVSAASVSGQDKDRAETLAGFREGRYQHLVNAMLLTEGWNAPFVDSVVVLRPTRSRALFAQMAGRCLRKYPGKPEGFIWGVNWSTHVHDLVHPVQIYDSLNLRIKPEVLAGAKALINSGEEMDLSAALKKSQAECKERRRVELSVKAAPAKATLHTFDMLSGRIPKNEATPSAAEFVPLATDSQVRQLVRFGIDPSSASGWSKNRARGFIGSQFDRIQKGLCSYKQQVYLKKLGHPSPAKLTFPEASAAIERLKRAV